jgi:hypothetical protein
MANSLRSKLSKLRHDGNISDNMYHELLNKLNGHDRELRAKAIDEFVANAEKWNNNIKSIRNEEAFFTIENICEIAEQMKAGAV